MKLFFFFQTILFCFHGIILASPAKPIILEEDQKEYALGFNVEVLQEANIPSGRTLLFQEVSSPYYDSLFYLNSHPFINFKRKGENHWIRFKVKNAAHDSSVQWVLETNQWYSEVEMFMVYSDNTVVRKKANTVEQELDDAHVLLRLDLPPEQEVVVYLLMSGDKHYLTIWEEGAFLQYARLRDMLYSAFLGIFIIMALYNLILFYTIRDVSYLYYSLYCVGFILFQIIMTGYGFQFVWPNHSWVNQQWLSVLSFTTFFGISAARSFLNIRQFYLGLDRFIQFLLIISGGFFLGAVLNFSFISFPVVLGTSALTAVALFIAALLVWRKGFGPARYYLLGWTFLLVSIIIYYLSVVDLIPFTLFTSHVVKICSVIEIVLLSLGLADRINVSKKEERKAQEEVIKALQENDKLKDAANQALEEKARELELAYNALLESQDESAKLQELDQIKTRFFANISHEFRTPLTLILGHVEHFLKEKKTDEKSRKEYEIMHRNARRLLQLINQLLDLAKLEAGELQLKAEQMDVNAFLQAYVSSFSSLAENKGIQLRYSSEGSLPEAFVDKDKLEKIIGNLLSNAFKFTPVGGSILVRLGKAEELEEGRKESVGYFKIVVKDTGIGIKKEKLERIFDRFFQEDSSFTRSYSGSGIGLALVKELVKALCGQVYVQSEHGQGACFTVLLPLGKAHLKEGEIVNNTGPIEMHSGGYLVENPLKVEKNNSVSSPQVSETKEPPLLLIVEDNVDVRSFITTIFAADYAILAAENGEQGLKLALEHVPDIIISDLMMPGMDGFELCKKIKTTSCTSHIPVILLTARANSQCKIEGLGTGADDYMIKPFKPHELQLRVQNLIEGRRRLRRLFSKDLLVKPKDITVNSLDEQFLNKLTLVLEKNYDNSSFSVESLATELNMSRSQLHRKLTALVNQSASEYVRKFRLQRAGQLISSHHGNVADIAYKVGFNNLSYFSKCFRELYGITPSEYAESKRRSVEVLSQVPN